MLVLGAGGWGGVLILGVGIREDSRNCSSRKQHVNHKATLSRKSEYENSENSDRDLGTRLAIP